MSRRGSSTEQLQENRKGNLFENFLNNIKGSYDASGLSFEQFLPAPFRINYDITRRKIPYEKELTSVFSFLNKDNKDDKKNPLGSSFYFIEKYEENNEIDSETQKLINKSKSNLQDLYGVQL